jgi:hypothetical protein
MKKIIIVSASVVVLAFIVGISLYAQNKSERSNAIEVAQADGKISDSCQKCPVQSQCSDDEFLTDTTSAKVSNVACDKSKGCKMESCHQSSKCQEMRKGSTACNASHKKECRMKSCGKSDK